jgi:DNA-binding MarR family transcriptional regulator
MARRRGADSREVDDTAAWHPRSGRSTSILFDVYVLGQRTRALVASAMNDAGLRPEVYAAYSVVFEMEAVTLTDLAARLGLPVTTVADTVRTMTKAGHLRRKPHPTDRRAALLALTPAGLRAHRRASGSFERAHEAMRRELGPLEEDSAREVLQQLTRGAERALDSVQARGVRRAG